MEYRFDKWVLLEKIGGGGQGEVHRAVRIEEMSKSIRMFRLAFKNMKLTGGSTYHSSNKPHEHLQYDMDFAAALRRVLDPNMDCRVVALKILNERTKKSLLRAEAGLEVLEQVNHPSLIRVVEKNLEEGWVAYDYCSGGSLAHNLKRFEGKPLDAVKALFPVAEALRELHDSKFVHRDIKPENIFLGSNGQLILGDLDLAFDVREDNTRITSTNENVGTRDYTAPWIIYKKQVPIDEIRPSCDVYALARVLWAMIAGEDTLEGEKFEVPRHDLTIKLKRRTPIRCDLLHVNEFLRRYVCRDEEDVESPSQFAWTLFDLSRRLSAEERRKCVICEQGRYGGKIPERPPATLVCDQCGFVVDIPKKYPQWVDLLVRDGILGNPSEEPST